MQVLGNWLQVLPKEPSSRDAKMASQPSSTDTKIWDVYVEPGLLVQALTQLIMLLMHD
jgi:hypothetical protein